VYHGRSDSRSIGQGGLPRNETAKAHPLVPRIPGGNLLGKSSRHATHPDLRPGTIPGRISRRALRPVRSSAYLVAGRAPRWNQLYCGRSRQVFELRSEAAIARNGLIEAYLTRVGPHLRSQRGPWAHGPGDTPAGGKGTTDPRIIVWFFELAFGEPCPTRRSRNGTHDGKQHIDCILREI